MNKITEIIPDDIPEWANEAIRQGNFFSFSVAEITRLQAELTTCKDENLHLLGVIEETGDAKLALRALKGKDTP